MSRAVAQQIAVLVLAAGQSARMGQPKQLLPWQGTTLIGQAIATAQKISLNYLVVLGAHATAILPTIPKDKAIMNPNWENGMGTSLAFGVAALEKKYKPKAILVLLVDQPLIAMAHYDHLIAQYVAQPSKIHCSAYKKGQGVPALFPASFFDALKTLSADQGARQLLQTQQAAVTAWPPKGQLIDLDNWEDYSAALAALAAGAAEASGASNS